jgi:hypothetical protein
MPGRTIQLRLTAQLTLQRRTTFSRVPHGTNDAPSQLVQGLEFVLKKGLAELRIIFRK